MAKMYLLVFLSLVKLISSEQPDPSCLQCICQATSNCDSDNTKCPQGSGYGTFCGPYQIDRYYWEEGNSIGYDFETCVNFKPCAERVIINFMKKYARDCNGDGLVDCLDYAAIHRLGPERCSDPSIYESDYWQQFSQTQCILNPTLTDLPQSQPVYNQQYHPSQSTNLYVPQSYPGRNYAAQNPLPKDYRSKSPRKPMTSPLQPRARPQPQPKPQPQSQPPFQPDNHSQPLEPAQPPELQPEHQAQPLQPEQPAIPSSSPAPITALPSLTRPVSTHRRVRNKKKNQVPVTNQRRRTYPRGNAQPSYPSSAFPPEPENPHIQPDIAPSRRSDEDISSAESGHGVSRSPYTPSYHLPSTNEPSSVLHRSSTTHDHGYVNDSPRMSTPRAPLSPRQSSTPRTFVSYPSSYNPSLAPSYLSSYPPLFPPMFHERVPSSPPPEPLPQPQPSSMPSSVPSEMDSTSIPSSPPADHSSVDSSIPDSPAAPESSYPSSISSNLPPVDSSSLPSSVPMAPLDHSTPTYQPSYQPYYPPTEVALPHSSQPPISTAYPATTGPIGGRPNRRRRVNNNTNRRSSRNRPTNPTTTVAPYQPPMSEQPVTERPPFVIHESPAQPTTTPAYYQPETVRPMVNRPSVRPSRGTRNGRRRPSTERPPVTTIATHIPPLNNVQPTTYYQPPITSTEYPSSSYPSSSTVREPEPNESSTPYPTRSSSFDDETSDGPSSSSTFPPIPPIITMTTTTASSSPIVPTRGLGAEFDESSTNGDSILPSNPVPPHLTNHSISVSDQCLVCLCQSTESCNNKGACANPEGPCGPYQVTYEQWTIAGKPKANFQKCASSLECSRGIVKRYLSKNGIDCNQDSDINCVDFALIHRFGLDYCKAIPEDLFKTGYWLNFENCYGFERK